MVSAETMPFKTNRLVNTTGHVVKLISTEETQDISTRSSSVMPIHWTLGGFHLHADTLTVSLFVMAAQDDIV